MSTVYLTARQLRDRWGGRSHMFIERLLKNDPTFPRPVRLGGAMRFWRLDEIEAWESRSEAGQDQNEQATAGRLVG